MTVPEPSDGLFMRTHVGRNIIQSAQAFLTVEAALWEYVVNSLQYVAPGVTPQVDVRFNRRKHEITIADNGIGMSREGLRNFFTMHGENTARRVGRPGRGKYGTGKSAAFGVGTTLRVDTTCGHLRNVAELTLEDIKAAGDGPVPVRQPVIDEPAPGQPNTTTVCIGGVSRPVNHDAVRHHLERYLTTYRNTGAQVFLDGIPVEPWAPSVRATRQVTPPPGPLADALGDIVLTIYTTAEPLDPDERGVSVTIGAGNLVAREGAGVTTKEWGNYLFGEVDCPALETGPENVAAFGSNRDLKLNPEHPVAGALVGFIGWALEEARGELVADYKRARQGVEAQRLKATAEEIAQILNADFTEQAARLEAIAANVQRRTSVPAHAGPEQADPDDPAFIVSSDGVPGRSDGTAAVGADLPDPTEPTPGTSPTGDHDPGGDLAAPAGQPETGGAEQVRPVPAAGGQRPRGGLQVEYEHLGGLDNAPRSLYDSSRTSVVINLDHPAIEAAAQTDGGVTGVAFKRLSYEVAFTEYALLVAQMEYERNPEIDASDALFEVRHTLLRITSRSAVLYAQ